MQPEDLSAAVLLRRLHRAQLDNALVRNKAQWFIALRALSRSLQLRQQLTRSRQAREQHRNSTEDGNGIVPTPPPLLDPSIKALIEKLTQIAELLPAEMNHNAPSVPNRMTRGGGDDDDDNNDERTEGLKAYAPKTSTKHNRPGAAQSKVADSSDFCQSRQDQAGTTNDAGGWSDGEENQLVRRRSGEKGVEDDDVAQEAGEGSLYTSRAHLLDEEVDPENATVGQRLNEIDSTVESLFQDLEEKSKQPASWQETDGNPRQENPSQAEAEKKRAEKARKRQRALYVAQLGGKMTKIRRPRWRWISDGIPNPPPDQVLSGRSFWRAAVFLVIVFFVRPRRNILQRKARYAMHKRVHSSSSV